MRYSSTLMGMGMRYSLISMVTQRMERERERGWWEEREREVGGQGMGGIWGGGEAPMCNSSNHQVLIDGACVGKRDKEKHELSSLFTRAP